MFKLIRRISYSVIPRSDRPWEEDPTSNAPQIGRKRRLSSTERDAEDEEQAHKKKAREDSTTPSMANAEGEFLVPAPRVETQEVKAVTQGVEEVVLDGKDDEISSAAVAAPESIPLPDEHSGELDEPTSDDTPPPIEAPSTIVEESPKVVEEPTTIAADDSSDVASSVGEDDSPPEVAQQPKPLDTPSTPLVQTALGPSNNVTIKK